METVYEFTRNHYCYYPDLEEVGEWLVLQYEDGSPIESAQYSSLLSQSNYEVACSMLDEVESHDFYNGWIIVKPGTEAERIGEEIERSLANYPILDESDLSEREMEEYYESWVNYGARDFAQGIVDKFDLDESAEDFILDYDTDKLLELYESVLNHYYETESDGVRLFVSDAIEELDEIETILEPFYREQVNALYHKACLTGFIDRFDEALRPFWDDREPINGEVVSRLLAL